MRINRKRKPVNLTLSSRCIATAKRLAREDKRSMSNLLEVLIDREHANRTEPKEAANVA